MNDEEAKKCLEIARAAIQQKDYGKVDITLTSNIGREVRLEESAFARNLGGSDVDAPCQDSFSIDAFLFFNIH